MATKTSSKKQARKTKKPEIRCFTQQELAALARLFLDKFATSLAADFRPEEPLWRALLAKRLAEFQYRRGRVPKSS